MGFSHKLTKERRSALLTSFLNIYPKKLIICMKQRMGDKSRHEYKLKGKIAF